MSGGELCLLQHEVDMIESLVDKMMNNNVCRDLIAPTYPGIVSRPTVWYEEFGDDNVNFYAVMRAKGYIDSWRVKHSFIKAISTRFRTENIEISFHNTNIFMRDES